MPKAANDTDFESLKSAFLGSMEAARNARLRASFLAAHEPDRLRMAKLSDDQVKRLWDAYDGMNSPLGITGEAIHFELNLRGHGEYCAV